MNIVLEKFWKWFGKTPEEHATCDIEYIYGNMEYDYPYFDELEKYAFKVVDNDIIEYDEIYDLITIMALDNESENVLDYIEDYSSNTQIEKIVEIGLYSNFDIDDVITYFNGSGKVVFSNEPDKYYNYQIIEQIDFA